jgi:hypothetical protein
MPAALVIAFPVAANARLDKPMLIGQSSTFVATDPYPKRSAKILALLGRPRRRLGANGVFVVATRPEVAFHLCIALSEVIDLSGLSVLVAVATVVEARC